MATSTDFKVAGLAELDAVLKALPAEIEGKIMAGALRAGQRVVQNAAKSNLDAAGAVDDGALRDTMRIAASRRARRRGWVVLRLIAGNRRKKTDPLAVWYAHMIEFGTASFYAGTGRTVGKPYLIKPREGGALKLPGGLAESVTHPGIRPRKFLRRAFDDKSKASIEAIVEYLRRRIPREVQKMRKK
jgi:HK97 gp10 family phage protein